jgi:GNAT superfamily N-acetyltransferase
MIEILPLAERSECIEQLARWHFAQWGPINPTSTVERRIERLRGHLEPGRVPQTFVAVDGDRLLGSASLVAADLPSRDDLSPWLASVYVDPPFRNRGVGAALVKRVAQEARSLDFPTLYLFTPDRAAFYANLGWQVVERDEWNGCEVTVMELKLNGE